MSFGDDTLNTSNVDDLKLRNRIEKLESEKTELLAALRFVINRENLMFAECSDAEEILATCRAAILYGPEGK